MPSTSVVAYEPLLQHYGIRTTWLDLVDNIWTALWFASHTAYISGSNKQYIHYEISSQDFSYIYVLSFGKMKTTLRKCTKERIRRLCEKEGNLSKNIEKPTYGFFETDDYTLIDLRYMTPSLYKRPHSQHAILARRSAFSSDEDINYDDARVCTLRIETQCALKWLGNGILSDVHFMFPPPKYDPGYRSFLEKKIPPQPAFLGSIQYIGA